MVFLSGSHLVKSAPALTWLNPLQLLTGCDDSGCAVPQAGFKVFVIWYFVQLGRNMSEEKIILCSKGLWCWSCVIINISFIIV